MVLVRLDLANLVLHRASTFAPSGHSISPCDVAKGTPAQRRQVRQIVAGATKRGHLGSFFRLYKAHHGNTFTFRSACYLARLLHCPEPSPSAGRKPGLTNWNAVDLSTATCILSSKLTAVNANTNVQKRIFSAEHFSTHSQQTCASLQQRSWRRAFLLHQQARALSCMRMSRYFASVTFSEF